MPRSEQAILREEIARLTAENVELREVIILAYRESNARGAKIASLEARIAEIRTGHADEMARAEAKCTAEAAGHADEMARAKAKHAAEAAELAALVASRDARIGELEGGSRKLARSDRYHNGPHSPSSTNSWTSERRSREAARQEERQAG